MLMSLLWFVVVLLFWISVIWGALRVFCWYLNERDRRAAELAKSASRAAAKAQQLELREVADLLGAMPKSARAAASRAALKTSGTEQEKLAAYCRAVKELAENRQNC